jgi:REP element-mobilizing transposase RayT
MAKFKNKYRSESHRRPNWDYSANALYFLTIVTQHRVCNLGKVVNNEMILSDFGNIVETEWFKSFDIRKELFLDEFIMMPNHLHTIVEINNRDVSNKPENDIIPDDGHTHDRAYQQSPLPDINTDDRASQQSSPQSPPPNINTDDHPYQPIKRNPPIRLPQSISSFIAGFKSAVNTKIDDYIDEKKLNIPKYNRNNHFFQPNHHDHIIRNDREYQRIKNYIINNPANWEKDTFNDTKNG